MPSGSCPSPSRAPSTPRSWPAARRPLRKALGDADFRSPEMPVVANVDARIHIDPGEWPGLLSAQLCSPVRWRQSLETLGGRGVTTLSSSVPVAC